MGTRPDLSRVRERPDPTQWDDDELMTLPEAAELMWPSGPLRTASLRTAARDGQLVITIIAGKHLTTKAALRAMASDSSRPAHKPVHADDPLSAQNILHHLVAASETARLSR